MKLKDEFKIHQEIFNQGYRFNPDDEIFYTTDLKKFIVPPNYEDWKVQEINKDAYRNERLKELGINPKKNIPTVEIIDHDGAKFESEIFIGNIHGDLEIIQYDLHRKAIMYERGSTSAGTRWGYCVQKRINPLYEPFVEGKYDFSEARNAPFWHPSMIDKFENKEEVKTLVITEGQIKAFKAVQDGIDTVGLTSISHFRDSQTKELHTEIIEFIHVCKVKQVIILWDGDCQNISIKDLDENREVQRRPAMFYSFAKSIRDSIYRITTPKKVRVYHATIKSDDIPGNPKGIDDLLTTKGISAKDIVKDFKNIGEIPGYYIKWLDISTVAGVKDMREFYRLTSVYSFYGHHEGVIKGNPFNYYGNTYKIEEGKPVLEISADLKEYKLIGTEFYRLMKVPMPSGRDGDIVLEERLKPWKKEIINMQHGKDAVHKIESYDGFTNIPNHIEYQQVINNSWNLYVNVKHEKREGDWPTIRTLLSHIFQEQFDNDMILDYITVLYRFPMQKLPILALLSEEQGTGKSTFIFLMKLIFKQNMTIVANSEIVSDFNSNWISSLIVACEESIFERAEAYEKLKSLSTAKTVSRNEKNKAQDEIPCMLHFIFASNHPDDFMKISKYDRRLWAVKVHPFKKKTEKADITFDKRLEDELPAFIHFLENREITYIESGELFFHQTDFQTDAFTNLVNNSEPGLVKNLREELKDYFLKYEVTELKLQTKDLYNHFGVSQRFDLYYLRKVLQSYFNADTGKQGRYSFFIENHADLDAPLTVSGRGRLLEFKYEDFVTPADIEKRDKNNKQLEI